MKERFIITIEFFRKLLTEKYAQNAKKKSDEILQDKHLGPIYRNLHDDEFLVKKFIDYKGYSPAKGYQEFVTTIRKRRLRKWLIRGGSVAAIVIISLSTIWMYHVETVVPSTNEPFAIAEKSVIPAGSSKAQITLANGDIVHMDNDSLRLKVREGIEINYTGGKISYKNSEEITELVYNKLEVPIGGECYIVLDDGTGVWVNAGSKLTYPVKFVGAERVVELEGEAYFEVTPGNKPFIVRSTYGNVYVHGTSFNVKSYKEEEKTYTTLVSGKVSCTYENQEIELQPGEQAITSKHEAMEKRKVNVAEYIGWKDGLYIFKRRSLGSIMNELARWYDIEVVYKDEGLKNILFTGNLKRYDTINTFMKIIKRSGDINYRIEGKTIILYK